MSHHNPKLYPEHNTTEIHAGLNLHGLIHNSPSVTSDSFRFGWLAAKRQTTKEELIMQLESLLELNLSGAEYTRMIIDKLKLELGLSK